MGGKIINFETESDRRSPTFDWKFYSTHIECQRRVWGAPIDVQNSEKLVMFVIRFCGIYERLFP